MRERPMVEEALTWEGVAMEERFLMKWEGFPRNDAERFETKLLDKGRKEESFEKCEASLGV